MRFRQPSVIVSLAPFECIGTTSLLRLWAELMQSSKPTTSTLAHSLPSAELHLNVTGPIRLLCQALCKDSWVLPMLYVAGPIRAQRHHDLFQLLGFIDLLGAIYESFM